MKIIEQPHDAVFKSSLSCMLVAKKFFEIHLPKNILDLINLNTLKLCSENFIADDLQKYSSDLIYQVCFKNIHNNKHNGLLYLLIEHESNVNYIMQLRLHNYLNLIIQKHLKQHTSIKKLPLAFAIIYYTGKKQYFKSCQFFNKFPDISLAKQLFNVPHKLVALNQFSDLEIVEQHEIINLLEFVQKNIYIKDFFVHNKILKELFNRNNIVEYKQSILKYLYSVANVTDKQGFYNQLKTYEKRFNARQCMGTVAEYLIEKGEKKGIRKGIQLGRQEGRQELARAIAQKMLKANLDFKIISKFTGIKLADTVLIVNNFLKIFHNLSILIKGRNFYLTRDSIPSALGYL